MSDRSFLVRTPRARMSIVVVAKISIFAMCRDSCRTNHAAKTIVMGIGQAVNDLHNEPLALTGVSKFKTSETAKQLTIGINLKAV